MKNKLIRSRVYCTVLYPEDESQVKALDYIKANYHSAYILHSLDFNEFGVLKKPHWHVVMQFANARSRKSVADEIGVAENYLEKTSSLEAYLLYLIHHGDTNKHQYSIEEVKGTLAPKLTRILARGAKDESDQVAEIQKYICQPRYVSMSELMSFCQKNGYWSTLRRAGNLFRVLLNEHNNSLERSHGVYGN